MADFVVEYRTEAEVGLILNAAIEAMFTIRPGCSAFISLLATSLERRYGPTRLVSTTPSIKASSCLIAHWASTIPALLINVLIKPIWFSTTSTAFLILSLSCTSKGTTAHSPPSSLISFSRASSFSTLLAAKATLAPHLASTFENL